MIKEQFPVRCVLFDLTTAAAYVETLKATMLRVRCTGRFVLFFPTNETLPDQKSREPQYSFFVCKTNRCAPSVPCHHCFT